MNTENLDQSQNKEIPENNPNPNSSLIPEETKKLLASLLKHRLEEKITKLETKEKEDEETLKFVYKKFKGYISLLDVFTKETIKNLKERKELLKKKEEEKKSKDANKSHKSKSLAPHKKLEINTRNDILTNRTITNKNKNKISVNINNINNISRHNYQTEVPKKEHERPKTFKGRRIPLEKDSNTKIKPKPIKLDKITNISTPVRPEDLKMKTITNYNTEKKPESKTIHNSVIHNTNKSKSIKKKVKGNNLELSKNFSDVGKNLKKLDKFTSEKSSKKSINIIQDKLNKKNENKDKDNKKELAGKKLLNKKTNDKLKKAQPKTDKKEDKKDSKNDNIEVNKEKENPHNEKEEEKPNESKENIDEEKKEEVKSDNVEKKDEHENKNDNVEKSEQKEEKLISGESKNQEATKVEEKNKEENTAQIEKENKVDNTSDKIEIPKEEKIDSDKKDENKVDNTLDKNNETPKEEKPIEIGKKEENIKTENEKEINKITPEQTLEAELKKEEQKIIQENEANSLITQKPEEQKITEEIKQEEKEPKKIESQPQSPDDTPSAENSEKKEILNKEEEKTPIEPNNENKPSNENNAKLIETIRKDNEEMKKENEEELLKHYQSQIIDINLNQSINQNMSFSQSFLQSRSILGEQPIEKIKRDPNVPLTKDEILKKYKNYFIYIFDFLDFKDRVMFSGIHKGFKNERIYLLNTKREEAIASLELNERETINDRLNKFMTSYSSSEYKQPLSQFTIARNSATAIVSIDKETFSKLFKQKTLDIKLSEIYIVYRVLFLLFGEQKIAEIVDDGEFWEKCIEYLNTNGGNKIGSFILEKSKSFDFSKNSIYLINKLLVGIKPNFTTAHFSKVNGTTGLLMFIIRDALEYAGIIVTKRTPKSRIYNNLVYYKNLIENLTNFIDYLVNIEKK